MAEPLTSEDPRQVGGYQVRARLGAGGMGQVYLAITPAGRRVALKMVRAEYGDDERFRARFRQEVSAAQRVHGLFTAQVLDADPDAPQPWLATSYVPGLSLRQAVTEFGPLPTATVVLLVAGTAEALQAIHAAGIVHRDLKPANVILAADGPRVIDFGIAQAAAGPALTQGGSRVGSPRFMAPEQARGQVTTPAVDVFALGALATYASTGHPPFGTDHALAVLGRVLHDPPDLDGCPPELRTLIQRCLDKDPGQRPLPGDIIEACRAMAGGVLSFERPWLPAEVSAAAAAAEVTVISPVTTPTQPDLAGPEPADPELAGPEPADPELADHELAGRELARRELAGRGLARPELGGPEWTQGSESSRDASWAAAAEPGTDSGLIRDPAEPAGPAPVRPAAGALAAGAGLAEWARAGGATRLAQEHGAGNEERPGPGEAGPAETGPAETGATPGAGPGDAVPAWFRRRPGRAVAGLAAAAAVVTAVAAATAASLTGSGSHLADGGHQHQPAPATIQPSATTSTRAKVRRRPASRATPATPRQMSAAPSATLHPRRARPTPRASASSPGPRRSSPAPRPTGASPSPSPSATPAGQAAFGGNWDGTVSQPGWKVPSWELQVYIPAHGEWGSYSAPSLGCSGTVKAIGVSDGTMTAMATTTSHVGKGCVKSAQLMVTLDGHGDLDLTWVPGKGNKPTGTAVLYSS